MGSLILYAIGFIILIVVVFANMVARKWGEQLKLIKKTYLINVTNIMFLFLFVAIYFPDILRGQINFADGVTELERRQMDLVLNLKGVIFNSNLCTRWISIFFSLVGWYANSNKFHLLICILNIIIGIVLYIMLGFALLLSGSGNIY